MCRSVVGFGAVASLLLVLVVRAQNVPTGKETKVDAGKAQPKDTKPADAKMPPADGKPSESSAGPAPPRPTLDKLKLAPGTIVVIVEKLKDAVEQFPKMILVSPEEYEQLNERLRLLEQQLKADKATTHSCKLTGKLEGDYLALKAEFTFSTQQPKAQVTLGLQGAVLVDEGDLDQTVPQLDHGEDGFVVRVAKEGPHQLTLNLKVPVTLKKNVGPSTTTERGIELGLPGAPATTLHLELPAAVKDLRINDLPRKNKTPGRWETPLGSAKQVNVTWKEPPAIGGGGPLLTLDAQIGVRIEESFVQLSADLVLEDPRGKADEWRLLLPVSAASTTPTVKSLPADAYIWRLPDAKSPWHVLKLHEPTAERITVNVQTSVQRPVAKVLVGPFALVGGFRQQGTILVQATPDALRGQRLIYHRQGEVIQREAVKGPAGVENLVSFQVANAAAPGPTSKAPVEIEFKARTGLAETQVEHTVRLRGEGAPTHLETTTRIQAKSLAEATDFLEVQLPRGTETPLDALMATGALVFPGLLPWDKLLGDEGETPWALPLGFRLEEEGADLATPAPDGSRRVRVKWSRQSGKQMTLTIHGKYSVPKGARRVRLELPRPAGVLDRGGMVTVSSGPLLELLTGAPGEEEAAPERQQWQRQFHAAPATVDVAWRPFQPPFPVHTVADVTLHDRSAEVRQKLQFTLATTEASPAKRNVRLRVPSTLKQLALESGGKLLGDPQAEAGFVWVAPQVDAAGRCELTLEYDVPLPAGENGDAVEPQPWDLPLVWPEGVTRREAKVRLWCAPGTFPALAGNGGDWHERGSEAVMGHASLPTLVVAGLGQTVPLTLETRSSDQAALAPLVCDRTLVHVQVDDEGNQSYRVRSVVRKLTARQLTLELPVDVQKYLLAVRLGPDRQEKALPWHAPEWNQASIATAGVTHVQTQPWMLEVEYKVPASSNEGKRLGQLTLYPPRWHGEVLPGTVRWQVEMPADQIAVVAGSDAVLDYRWALQGWLLAPEPSVTGADLEAWLTGRDNAEPAPVGLAYWRPGLTPQRLVHLPRQWWLLVCSGLVLALGLSLYLLPLGRFLLGLILVLIVVGMVVLALWLPALVPPLLYGCEPGLAVLITLLGLQWLWQERYRRQVVFMPGFARSPSGSSLSRRGQAPREVSTVDAPAPAAPSSVK